MGEDKSEKPTETTAAPAPAKLAKPLDVIEKRWDLVDPTPPPKAQASPPSPPPTAPPADPPSGGGGDEGASGE